MELVAGRECGPCTTCCAELAIDDRGLHKPAHELCVHCRSGQGCTIYESRPPTCRDWHCARHHLGGMPDSLRPDRSGLLPVITFDDISPAALREVGLVFNLLAATEAERAALLASTATVDILGALVRDCIAAFMAIPGPGGIGSKLLLNPTLGDARAQSGWPCFARRLLAAWRAARLAS